jgi:hypothetical protein
MELSTFTERERSDGDRLQAKEAVDRLLVVLVREHRTGIVTKFKPDGGEGVTVDVADVRTNEVWIDVLWMNGAVVDNLAPYVGQPVAIKLVWTPSASGGNPYIGVKALEGAELAAAQQWAAVNPTRFDQERSQRAAAAASDEAQQIPGAPAQPPAWVPQPATPAPAAAPLPPAAPVPPAAATPQPAPANPAPVADPNDPAVQALLRQIAGGQLPPANDPPF